MGGGPTPDNGWELFVRRGRTADAWIALSERTLVGCSRQCDVRLSEGLPPVHSVLTAGEDGVRLMCLHPEPWAIVGGQPVRECELREGDAVSIHGVELLVRRTEASAPTGDSLPSLLSPRRGTRGLAASVFATPPERTVELPRRAA